MFQYSFQYCSLDQKRFFKFFKRKKLLSGKFSSHARLANEKHLLWCLFNNTSMLICEAKKSKDLKQALCDDKWQLKIKSTLKNFFFYFVTSLTCTSCFPTIDRVFSSECSFRLFIIYALIYTCNRLKKRKLCFPNTHHVMFFRKCSFCLFIIYACIYTGRLEFSQYTPFFLSFHKLSENMHVHVIYAWLHSRRIWNFIETVPWGIITWSVLGQLIVFFTTCDGCRFSAI